MGDWGERLFSALLHAYPRAFRHRYRDDLIAFFRADRDHPKYGRGATRPIRFWWATLRDVFANALASRRAPASGASHVARGHGWSRLRRDVRAAWTGLWSAPTVTLSALAVLVLGIGAGTTVYSLVDAVALRRVPFPDGDRLVAVSERELPSGHTFAVAPQNYYDWRARQDAFQAIGAGAYRAELTLTGEPVLRVRPYAVTASLWEVLHVSPAIGRTFRAEDEQPNAEPVVIISDHLWRERFGRDPLVLGRVLAAAGRTLRIVGVMSPSFIYPLSSLTTVRVDAWVPLVETAQAKSRAANSGYNYNLGVVARLKPGVTADDALRRMTQVRDGLARQYPTWFDRDGVSYGVMVRPLKDAIVNASVQSWMLLLLGAVGVVVVMACLNAANLLVARAVVRGPELAVRTALGATRWDLARLLLLESVWLSLIGAAGGILVSMWGVEVLRESLPADVPRLAPIALNLRILFASVGTAFVTGLAFGTLPALQAARPDIVKLLGHGGRTSGQGGARRFRSVLVATEVGLAVISLAGASLFLTSFMRVTRVPLGFDPRHVVLLLEDVMSVQELEPAKTPGARDAAIAGQARVAAALEGIRAIPGVIAAAPMQGGRPFSGSYVTARVTPLDRPERVFVGDDEAYVRSAGPEYLNVLGAGVIEGRWIAGSDSLGAPPVIVLSEDAAHKYFASSDPIGQRLRLNDYERTVVGIVPSMRWTGPEAPPNPEVFIPFAQTSHTTARIVVRTGPAPVALVPALQAAIHAAMPDQVFRGTTDAALLEEKYSDLLAQRRFNMIILSMFGVAAVVIAAVGLYGLMTFVVSQRRRELGVRVALGAPPADVVRLVFGNAIRLTLAGLAPGLIAAMLLERLIRAFLFHATAHDPTVYAGAAVVLLASALAAAIGPARKAARVDPIEVLRLD